VTVERIFDADRLNEVLNDPEVRPDVADLTLGNLDVRGSVENPDNVLLMGEHGGVMFFKIMAGCYECHSQVRKSGRGQWAIDMVLACARHMFTKTDCFEITTRIPREHLGARGLAIKAGMSHEFSVDDGCVWRGQKMPMDIYSFRIQDWIKAAEDVEDTGRWFHRRLNEEAIRLGITDHPHENDDTHNRYVGASVEMAMAGQVQKSTLWYNRWAVCARHPIIHLISVDPPCVKMDIGLLTIRDGDIEVQLCA
jgi:hypothetical protein